MVKFNPLTVSIGQITHKSFRRTGNKDIWTYSVKFKSLAQLKKQSSGTLHLSVPIANIHDQTFKVWFAWGVKNLRHNSSPASLISASKMSKNNANKSTNAVPNENTNVGAVAPSSSASSKNDVRNKPNSDVKKSENTADDAEQITPSDLAKYSVSPKKQTYADIALVNYPFIPVILIFFVLDFLVIVGAIVLRRKIVKGGK